MLKKLDLDDYKNPLEDADENIAFSLSKIENTEFILRSYKEWKAIGQIILYAQILSVFLVPYLLTRLHFINEYGSLFFVPTIIFNIAITHTKTYKRPQRQIDIYGRALYFIQTRMNWKEYKQNWEEYIQNHKEITKKDDNVV